MKAPTKVELKFSTNHFELVDLLPTSTNVLLNAWEQLNGACLRDKDELDEIDQNKVIKHALCLATTCPSIFGDCLSLVQADRRAVFTLRPLPTVYGIDQELSHQRHDVVQWIVCHDLLGKAFDSDEWVSVVAESVVAPIDPTRPAIEVMFGRETIVVSEEAKKSMRTSLDYMANKPSLYFNCKQVAIAVTQILGKELLSYTMSQSKEVLMAFNWESVEAFEKDSYPEAPQPDKYDFQKVKAVHKLVKAEKDEEAKKCGMPHAGVPSHCTYLQRWKQWRDFHALYYHMHPDYTTQMVHDLVMGRLKLCKSLKDIESNMAEDVAKHLVKVRKERKKAELQQQLAATQAAEEEAKKKAAELEAQKAAKEIEKQQLEQRAASEFTVTGRQTRKNQQAAKVSAITTVIQEVADVGKEIAAATELARQKEREKQALVEQKRRAEQEAAKSAEAKRRKKTRRNDVTRLVVKTTPRNKAKNDKDWSPPMKSSARAHSYQKPGQLWEEAALRKLHLLSTLHIHLKQVGLVSDQLSFPTAMSVANLNGENSTYNERVFMYLVFLVISQER